MQILISYFELAEYNCILKIIGSAHASFNMVAKLLDIMLISISSVEIHFLAHPLKCILPGNCATWECIRIET